MLLAHVGLGGLHGLLGGAMGGEFAAEADDAGGLAGAALFEGGDAVGGACRLGLGCLVLLVGAPHQQAKGAEQGGAVEGLAEGGHAKNSLRYSRRNSSAVCSLRTAASISPMSYGQ